MAIYPWLDSVTTVKTIRKVCGCITSRRNALPHFITRCVVSYVTDNQIYHKHGNSPLLTIHNYLFTVFIWLLWFNPLKCQVMFLNLMFSVYLKARYLVTVIHDSESTVKLTAKGVSFGSAPGSGRHSGHLVMTVFVFYTTDVFYRRSNRHRYGLFFLFIFLFVLEHNFPSGCNTTKQKVIKES